MLICKEQLGTVSSNLSLYLPQKQYNRSIALTELLDLYFNNEVVELKCEKCQMVGACKATKLHAATSFGAAF